MRRRFSIQAAIAAAALAAHPAFAQEGTKLLNTPAEKFVTAPGGVDLRTGRFVYEETDLAIGGEGSAGLSFSRTLTANVLGHSNPFANLSHNWDIMVSEIRINMDDPPSWGQDFQINVHFGGRSQTYQSRVYQTGFTQMSSGPFAPLTFTGDRTSGATTYTYTAADGTVAEFRPIGNGDCSSTVRCAHVSKIVEVDGTEFKFSYATTGSPTGGAMRLAQVTSSRGYALLLEGSGSHVTKACLLNLAYIPAPASGLCPDGVPTARYAYVAKDDGSAALGGVTGDNGPRAEFRYGRAADGNPTIGFVKPGHAAPWLTNSFHHHLDELDIAQEVVDRQTFADGQSYVYSYDLSPPLANRTQRIAGGAYSNALGQRTIVKYAFPPSPDNNFGGSACPRFPCSPPRVEDRFTNWVYQQTPGPVAITDPLGYSTKSNFCDTAAQAATGRCFVLPDAQYVVDPEGIRTDLKYDRNGNAIEARRSPKAGATNPDGSLPAPIPTSAVYETSQSKFVNKPLSMTDARGNTTTWTYAPEHGGVLTETGPAVNGVTPQKRFTYVQRTARLVDGSAAGPPVWLLDRMSSCRTGNPSGAGCALGTADEVVTSYDYGPDGGPTNLLLRGQAVTADGTTLRTCYVYDGRGRKISETSPNGNIGLTACPGAAPISALPYTISTRFDADGRVTGTIGADPDGTGGNGAPAVRNSYDAAGRLTLVEEGILARWLPDSVQPGAWTGFATLKEIVSRYDALDRKTREWVNAAGATWSSTEYSYDLAGRPECTAVRMNPDAWAVPLADKCVPGPSHAIHGPDRISKTVYDSAGRPIESWEGVGTPLARREAHYTYNANGQKLTLTDARGFLAEMKYDGFGRQQRWVFPSKTATGVADQNDYEQYLYDVDGNRTSLRKRDGSILTFQYDALDRMTVKIVPERAGLTAAQTRDVHYEYDLRGLQTKARFDSLAGEGVTTHYDGFGRVTSSTLAMAGTSRTLGHLYDREGNRIRITHPDGVFMAYEFDGLSRLVRVREIGTDILAGFSYDAAGRRSGLTSGGTSSRYAYDPPGRLNRLEHDLADTSADQVVGLAYNPASQIRSRSGSNDGYAWTGTAAVSRDYAANGQNQYTAAGAASFAYDANGNLVSTVNPPWSTTYVYDVENRLVSASGTETAALVYDPLGRLFQVSSPAAGTIRFLHDDDALIGEYDTAGNMLRRYVHGADKGVDDPLIWYEYPASGWRRALVADQQGSIVAVADMFGNPIAINTYDEYGIRGPSNQGRFQYTGQAWIPELGMYYYKSRIYSPTLGRFLQTDPIGYDDQINLYAYVGNDPANRIDPSGERWEVTWHAVDAKVTGARHAAVRFTPNNQAAVKGNPLFNNVNSNGERYMTFSAGPVNLKLGSTVNKSSDLGPQDGSVQLDLPEGANEFQIFNRVATADRQYNDSLDYDFFPAKDGERSILVADDGYNSNSYASGLLEAARIKVPALPVAVPGYDKPVPKECFLADNKC